MNVKSPPIDGIVPIGRSGLVYINYETRILPRKKTSISRYYNTNMNFWANPFLIYGIKGSTKLISIKNNGRNTREPHIKLTEANLADETSNMFI